MCCVETITIIILVVLAMGFCAFSSDQILSSVSCSSPRQKDNTSCRDVSSNMSHRSFCILAVWGRDDAFEAQKEGWSFLMENWWSKCFWSFSVVNCSMQSWDGPRWYSTQRQTKTEVKTCDICIWAAGTQVAYKVEMAARDSFSLPHQSTVRAATRKGFPRHGLVWVDQVTTPLPLELILWLLANHGLTEQTSSGIELIVVLSATVLSHCLVSRKPPIRE